MYPSMAAIGRVGATSSLEVEVRDPDAPSPPVTAGAVLLTIEEAADGKARLTICPREISHGNDLCSNVTALLYDDRMLAHCCPYGEHPERPERISAVRDELLRTGLAVHCQSVPARLVTRAEVELVHERHHWDKIEWAIGVHMLSKRGVTTYICTVRGASSLTDTTTRLSCSHTSSSRTPRAAFPDRRPKPFARSMIRLEQTPELYWAFEHSGLNFDQRGLGFCLRSQHRASVFLSHTR